MSDGRLLTASLKESRSAGSEKRLQTIANSEIPLFFKAGVACEILGCSLADLRVLIGGEVLRGYRGPQGVRILTESVALYLGYQELKKRKSIWLKERDQGKKGKENSETREGRKHD